MRARLRTAWKATCGSSAHACTQRSPPLRARVELVAGKCGQVAQRAGRCAASPKRSSNSVGPKPERDRQPRGGQAERPRRCRPAAPRLRRRSSPTGAPGRHPRGGRPSTRAAGRAASVARMPSSTSKAAKCRRSCGGVAIPAWWSPSKATVASAARRRSAVDGSDERRRPRRRRPRRAAGGRQQPARRDRRAVAHPASDRGAPCESGSASASIDLAEQRTSCRRRQRRCRGRSRRPSRYGRSAASTSAKRARSRPPASGVLAASEGADGVERRARALDVGLEVAAGRCASSAPPRR